MTRANHKVPLSRHRKVQLSRSKAMVIAAAGALSVATAASATAATWGHGAQGAQSAADGLAEITHGSVAPDTSTRNTVTQVAAPREATAREATAREATAQEATAQEAAPALGLAVTDQLAGPIAQTATEQGNATWVQHAYLVRLTAMKDAIAQRQAASTTPASTTAAKSTLGSPQQVARAMLGSFGWSAASQFSCLEPLWAHESGWSVSAYNAGSGAFGIPQALPGSRMASAGPDWQTSAATQIKWGLQYIKGTYGSPCAAWAHEEAAGWY
jgi:hypothetical protein